MTSVWRALMDLSKSCICICALQISGFAGLPALHLSNPAVCICTQVISTLVLEQRWISSKTIFVFLKSNHLHFWHVLKPEMKKMGTFWDFLETGNSDWPDSFYIGFVFFSCQFWWVISLSCDYFEFDCISVFLDFWGSRTKGRSDISAKLLFWHLFS